jgi:hypothetical protein
MVRTQADDPCQREWTTVQATSLEDAHVVALQRPDVLQVYEVAWDPGYIT